MTEYPAAFRELVSALRQLPSVGPRSAERMALHLAESEPEIALRLSEALRGLKERVKSCQRCGFFAEDGICSICRDSGRDQQLWCVVEHASDVLRIERSNTYRGLYHVLGGRLSPLDGIGPENLTVDLLRRRLRESAPAEVILALGADVEGETTALYLVPILREASVRISRLATGLPAGGGLEFADSVTLGYALNGRREVS